MSSFLKRAAVVAASVFAVFAAGEVRAELVFYEYVVATDGASVNTGYVANDKSVIAFKGMYASRNGQTYAALFKDYTDADSESTRVILQNTNERNIYVCCHSRGGDSYSLNNVVTGLGSVMTGLLDRVNNVYVVNAVKVTGYKEVGKVTNKPVLLHDSGKAVTRLYYFTVVEDGETIHDFRPCEKDGEAGYYDLVTDVFCGREGATGALAVGGNVVQLNETINVIGDPVKAAVPNPDYGMHGGYAVGQQMSVSAPSAWTNAEEGVAAACIGYSVITNGVVMASGFDNSFAYTHPDCPMGVKLVWRWDVAYAVRSTPEVAASTNWAAYGSSVTLTATPPAGMAFSHWTNAVTGVSYSDNPLQVRATGPMIILPVYGWARHVATDGNDVTGDGTKSAPYASVEKALSVAQAYDTVFVAEGTYELTDTLSLTNAVRVIGAGMYKTTLKGTRIQGTDKTAIGKRGVYMNHVRAWLGGVTVTDCKTCKTEGCGIYLKAGTLDGVRSYQNASGLGVSVVPSPGAGLCMVGGLATNCVIQENYQTYSTGDRYGAGLCIDGGTFTNGKILTNYCNRVQTSGPGVYVRGALAIVRNTQIEGNHGISTTTAPGNYTYGLGVYMTANGVVENCRIVGNAIQGVYMTTGTLRNCLVIGHVNTSADYAAGVDVRGGGKVVYCTVYGNSAPNNFAGLMANNANAQIVNNIVYGNGSDGNITVSAGSCYTNVVASTTYITTASAHGNVSSDPNFTDPSDGDFTFDKDSPACDAAAPLDDVTCDIVGTERPQNEGPDIGCYECAYEVTGLEAVVSVSKGDWTVGETVTAEATVFGAVGQTTFRWFVDSVVYPDETGKTASFVGLSSGRHSISVEVSDSVETVTASLADPIAVRPTSVYVDDATGNDVENYPYDIAAKPAKTVNAAFDALGRTSSNTTTLHVASGTYALSKGLSLDTTCRVLGAGMGETILDGTALPETDRCVSLTAVGSKVVGVTLQNCKTLLSGAGLYMTAAGWVEDVCICGNETGMGRYVTPASGAGLFQSAGVVTNCVIENNRHNGTYGESYGAGVYISGGVLVDSVVTNNWRNRSQIRGAGVYASGSARLTRCQIVGNSNKTGTWDQHTAGMGLYLAGGAVDGCRIVGNGKQAVYASSGTLTNCLITGSASAPEGYSGGLQLAGATVVNCTIAGNESKSGNISDLDMSSGKFWNSIAIYARVTGGTFEHSLTNINPRFRNAAKGDFRLASDSPAIDAGDWTRLGATKDAVRAMRDLAGAARLSGRNVDIGCYECFRGGFTLIVR